MGEFLAMSGVAGRTRKDVARALREFASSKDGEMENAPAQAELFEHLIISGDEDGPVTVHYPSGFFGWDEASSFLSASLNAPVFSLHIHDGDLWMYVLFANGEEVDHFNPIPDYWSAEPSPEERSIWAGDAKIVARYWSVDPASVEKYLVTWDLEDDDAGKAYESDQFPINECWQLTDFMRSVGLSYPIDDDGVIHGEWYRFQVDVEL
jgi:hypothetical protein